MNEIEVSAEMAEKLNVPVWTKVLNVKWVNHDQNSRVSCFC